MAETKMEIIDGVRYKPVDAQRVRELKRENDASTSGGKTTKKVQTKTEITETEEE